MGKQLPAILDVFDILFMNTVSFRRWYALETSYGKLLFVWRTNSERASF
jgi:hypothetical protein